METGKCEQLRNINELRELGASNNLESGERGNLDIYGQLMEQLIYQEHTRHQNDLLV